MSSWPTALVSIWSPFPITVVCRSDEEAAIYAPLKPAFDAIAKRKLCFTTAILKAIDKLYDHYAIGDLLNTSRAYFTVLHGNGGREGIFMTW